MCIIVQRLKRPTAAVITAAEIGVGNTVIMTVHGTVSVVAERHADGRHPCHNLPPGLLMAPSVLLDNQLCICKLKELYCYSI
jgi:hypothetical protein